MLILLGLPPLGGLQSEYGGKKWQFFNDHYLQNISEVVSNVVTINH